MNIVNFLKNLAAPTVDEELAKLDAHLLADIGVNTARARTNKIRIPAEAGVRLV